MQFLVLSHIIIFSTNYDECFLSEDKKKKKEDKLFVHLTGFGSGYFLRTRGGGIPIPFLSQTPLRTVMSFEYVSKRRKVKANENYFVRESTRAVCETNHNFSS